MDTDGPPRAPTEREPPATEPTHEAMNDRQRQRLLDRLHRPSATVGKTMPEELTVQGTTIDLTAFVFECKDLDGVTGEARERVEQAKTDLRRERLARKQRIEDGDVSYEEGERLVESIHGIDRALNALEGLDEPDIEEQLRRKQLSDARELVSLIRQRPE